MKQLLEVKNIEKHFGGIKALTGATLSVPKGKITALIGPNGCGKSTLFNVINKLLLPKKGEIYLNQKEITNLPPQKIAKAGISRTFQNPTLFENLSLRDHIEIALLEHDESIIKALFKKKENFDKKIKETFGLVGLKKPLDTLGSDLSYGQRKLLDLAIAIAKPHEIILLDEPVAGVNPKLRKEIKTILRNLVKQGETILVIEHDMNFIMDLADHVYVMDEGKILVDGKPKEIQNNPKVLEAYLGEQ